MFTRFSLSKIVASFCFVIFGVLGFASHVFAGTLTNFSYSGTSYEVGATADYTFNYTLETADPNMIFYASWPAGFDLTSSAANVTVNGVPSSTGQEYWNGGGSGNAYIRLADPTAAAGAEISVTISDVINPSSSGTYSFTFFRTADSGGNGIDIPTSIDDISITAPGIPFSGQGAGTIGDPYLVANCVQLQEVSNNLSAYYELANDIDCSDTENWNGGKGFDPIGDVNNPFTGTFDGEGYEISNMYIDRADDTFGQGLDDESFVGIFAHASNATIKNIDVVNSKVKGYVYVGGIVGYEANSTLENLTFNIGTTDNDCDPGHCVWARFGEFGGGIVGYMNGGTITNVTTAGPVKGSGVIIGGVVGHMENATLTGATSSSNIDGGEYLGGVIGRATGSTITDAHASGNVLVVEEQTSGKQGNVAGGLIGVADGIDISNSSATGTVTGLNNIGGFVGSIFNSEISTSFATGEVTAGSSSAGGFAGFSGCGSSFYRVYATGNVSGNGYVGGFSGDDGCEGPGSSFSQVFATGNVVSINEYAGGFLGNSNVSTFNNVYSLGNVSGTTHVGGFLGRSSGSSITNVYSAGSVYGSGGEFIGGFIGENNDEAIHSFWDGTKAELEIGCGDDGPCVGVTESTTVLMNAGSTFIDAGWDLDELWAINPMKNHGYPYFAWQILDDIFYVIPVEVRPVTDITQTGAIFHAEITSGSANAYGFFFGLQNHADNEMPEPSETAFEQLLDLYPGTNGTVQEFDVETPFSYDLPFTDAFECNTTYYVRPLVYKAINMMGGMSGLGIGGETSFTTLPCDQEPRPRRRVSGGMAGPVSYTAQTTTTTAAPASSSKDTCPADQILTQNLKAGARNGKYHPYTKAIVTEVKILQAHMNRLGFNSGAIDGILGPITDGAIKRMQAFLKTKADGYVGPMTRALINNSCGSEGLKKS